MLAVLVQESVRPVWVQPEVIASFVGFVGVIGAAAGYTIFRAIRTSKALEAEKAEKALEDELAHIDELQESLRNAHETLRRGLSMSEEVRRGLPMSEETQNERDTKQLLLRIEKEQKRLDFHKAALRRNSGS